MCQGEMYGAVSVWGRGGSKSHMCKSHVIMVRINDIKSFLRSSKSQVESYKKLIV